MKVKILAIALLILTASTVALNTFFLTKKIEQVTTDVQSLTLDAPAREAQAAAAKSFDNFKREENYLSLTVNHNDLSDIEGLYSEMLAYLAVEDIDGAKVAKSRLIDALSHLKRLSGINISSIF